MNETLTAPDPERVKSLEAARSAAYDAYKDAERTLNEAEQALLEEQCRDLPRYAKDDVILVPKTYFGKMKLVEAKVIAVHLHYSSGVRLNGGFYESKHVSYTVFLMQKDGEFGGSSEGFDHREVVRMPQAAEDRS